MAVSRSTGAGPGHFSLVKRLLGSFSPARVRLWTWSATPRPTRISPSPAHADGLSSPTPVSGGAWPSGRDTKDAVDEAHHQRLPEAPRGPSGCRSSVRHNIADSSGSRKLVGHLLCGIPLWTITRHCSHKSLGEKTSFLGRDRLMACNGRGNTPSDGLGSGRKSLGRTGLTTGRRISLRRIRAIRAAHESVAAPTSVVGTTGTPRSCARSLTGHRPMTRTWRWRMPQLSCRMGARKNGCSARACGGPPRRHRGRASPSTTSSPHSTSPHRGPEPVLAACELGLSNRLLGVRLPKTAQ